MERRCSGYCWQTPTAPEARGILAGGGAKRRRRRRRHRNMPPERSPDRDWSYCEFWSGVPAGTRAIFFDLSRWLRYAPPPANVRRPSGARNNFTEFTSSIARERFGSPFRYSGYDRKGSPPRLLSLKSVESADDYQSGPERRRPKGCRHFI